MTASPDYSQAVADIIDGLGDSPTPDEVYHAVKNYSVDHVVAAAAAEAKAAGGGGGGSQPFATVEVDPGPEQLYGLLIQALAGFYDVYNAFIRILDENGVEVLNIDSGGLDMTAPSGQQETHLRFSETDTANSVQLSSRALTITANGASIIMSKDKGIQINAFTPLDTPGTDKLQVYFDSTPSAAKVKFRAKDSDGTDVAGEIALS